MGQLDEFWCSMLKIDEGIDSESFIDNDLLEIMDTEIQEVSLVCAENGFKQTEINNVYINPSKEKISIVIGPDRAICINTGIYFKSYDD
jgi:hypothetical protein